LQASASDASVKGLQGCKTLNKDPDPQNPVEGREERCVMLFVRGFLNRYKTIINCAGKENGSY